jgi:hypothetical protein
MKTSSRHFGILLDIGEALIFSLQNDTGISLEISNYGGTIISLSVPDKNGATADIVLGLPTWEEWIENPPYLTALSDEPVTVSEVQSSVLVALSTRYPKTRMDFNYMGDSMASIKNYGKQLCLKRRTTLALS